MKSTLKIYFHVIIFRQGCVLCGFIVKYLKKKCFRNFIFIKSLYSNDMKKYFLNFLMWNVEGNKPW